MNVGIIAHNSKKPLIEDFCIAYKNILAYSLHFLQSLSSCCNSFSLLIHTPVQIPLVKSQYQGFRCSDVCSDRDIVLVTAP